MGNCMRHRNNRSMEDFTDGPTFQSGKNQQLKTDNPKWKSDVPLTDNQLQSKRNEFWDTAPAFEGRKEIWDALKAAAHAAESQDFVLAQAIVDGANISLPNGNLLECYDELGNRYQVPVYCLSAPVNLAPDNITQEDSPSPESEPLATGVEIAIKLRLSTTGRDTKLVVKTGETILSAKRRLESIEGIEPSRQRWFFSGRLLTDKMKIEEAKLQTGFVIQVVVAPS